MADRYSFSGAASTDTTENYAAVIIAVGNNTGALGKRGWIYDVMWGTQTAADAQVIYKLCRCATLTTTISTVPEPLDYSAPDPILLGGAGTFGGGTIGDILLNLAANQRSTQRWVAAPGGELGIPSADNQTIGFEGIVASPVTVNATIHFEE